MSQYKCKKHGINPRTMRLDADSENVWCSECWVQFMVDNFVLVKIDEQDLINQGE